MVGRLLEVDLQSLAETGAHLIAEILVGVDAGAHRGAADGQVLGKPLGGSLSPEDSVFDLGGKPAEFLTKPNGGCILKVGAAGLDDVIPLLFLAAKHLRQLLKGGNQISGDGHRRGNRTSTGKSKTSKV